MTTVAHAAELLHQTLKVVANVDAPFLDKARRLSLAQDGMSATVCFLDEIVAAHPEECAGHWPSPGPADYVNPTRRIYEGEDFPTYLRRDADFRGITSGMVTTDKAWAELGEHGFDESPASIYFEDTLIDVLRADLARLIKPAESRAVADDEIDEDPDQEPALTGFSKEEIDLGADVYLELVQIGSAGLAAKVAEFFGIDTSEGLQGSAKA